MSLESVRAFFAEKAPDISVIESTQSAERDVPEYVTADHKEMKGTFVRGPKLADVVRGG